MIKNADTILKSLTLREKISQMFIMGFAGEKADKNITNAVKDGLGGVILFADNIKSISQTACLVQSLQNDAKIPLFTSIDQEGGLVERTINSDEKIEYLTSMALCASNNVKNVETQAGIMAEELKSFHINMNFAPVLDVNTDKTNPIVGIRAFSSNTDEVIKYSEPVYRIFKDNNIIAVGKHFPGHGETGIDSHFDLPVINLDFDKLEKIHTRPFKEAIKRGIDAIMVAHACYPAFNADNPASLSKEVIDYLKNNLSFKGLIISDDMVMGSISNNFDRVSACIKAINAGIDLMIFRDSSDENMILLDRLADSVKNKEISEERINESVRKILLYKEKYGILSGKNIISPKFNVAQEQVKIDKIALDTIKTEKRGHLIPLDKSKKVLILSPDKSQIHSYAKNRYNLSDFLANITCQEINYSLNPAPEEIHKLVYLAKSYDVVIFISYNAILNKGQIDLFNSINKPVIAVASGMPYDAEEFAKADTVLLSFGYKTPAIKALAENLLGT